MIFQLLLSILCTICSLAGNILLLEQELSMLAKPQSVTKPMSPLQCAQRPRPLYNPHGACFMNTVINLIARMYCYPEIRNTITSRQKPSNKELENFRDAFITELEQYHASHISNDHFFENDHPIFLTRVNEIGFFSVCAGDFSLDVLFNSIEFLLKDDIRIEMSRTHDKSAPRRILKSPVQLLQVPLMQPCTKIDLACDLFYLTLDSSLGNYPWPKLLIVSTDIGTAKEMIKTSAHKQPTGKVTFPSEINIGEYYELKEALRYQLIGIIAFQPKHSFAIVKYRSTWYWCNDQNLLVLTDDKIQEAQVQGFFKIAKDEEIVWLWPIQGKPKYPQDEFAIPAVFVYERVTP